MGLPYTTRWFTQTTKFSCIYAFLAGYLCARAQEWNITISNKNRPTLPPKKKKKNKLRRCPTQLTEIYTFPRAFLVLIISGNAGNLENKTRDYNSTIQKLGSPLSKWPLSNLILNLRFPLIFFLFSRNATLIANSCISASQWRKLPRVIPEQSQQSAKWLDKQLDVPPCRVVTGETRDVWADTLRSNQGRVQQIHFSLMIWLRNNQNWPKES